MRRIHRTAALLLTLVLTIGFFSAGVRANAYSGSDYTSNILLAQKLDAVINGEAKLFSNSQRLYGVGDSIDVHSRYTWGPYGTWGYSCLAYAQAVYYYLFGELSLFPGAPRENSSVALENLDGLSYEVMANAGIGCGAYIRSTGNSDGSYNVSNGHSMILLTYDEETITFLEGNANYYGLIALQNMTWEEFNRRRFTNAGRRLSYIIQPDVTKGTVNAYAPLSALLETVPVAGDFDDNGTVDSADARMALRTAVGLEEIETRTREFLALDVNQDGKITSEDARIILRISVGLED